MTSLRYTKGRQTTGSCYKERQGKPQLLMFARDKRKSFLFFNTSTQSAAKNGDETEGSRNTNKSPPQLNSKKILSGPALRNTDIQLYSDVSAGPSLVRDKGIYNFNEIQDESMTIQRTTTTRRPPPPTVDITTIKPLLGKKLSTSPEAATSNNKSVLNESSEKPEGCSETILSEDQGSNVKINEGHKTTTTEFQVGHKRQKSEVEQLMDDLDDYISKSQLEISDRPGVYGEYAEHTVWSDIDESRVSSNLSNEVLTSGHSVSIEQDEKVAKSDDEGFQSSPIPSDDQFSFNPSQRSTFNEYSQQSPNSALSLPSHSSAEASDMDFQYNEEKLLVNSSITADDSTSSIKQGGIEEDGLLSDTNDQQSAKKNFRVVNDEKASFYFHDSTTDDEDSSLVVKEAIPRDTTEEDSILYIDSHEFMKRQATLSDENYTNGLNENSIKNSSPSKALSDAESLEAPTIDTSLSLPTSRTSGSSGIKAASTDKNVRLISSYVEELRLIYFPTSNSLQLPPNLPYALKNKNTLEQPQNIKVRIRTSTRQVGIKHGKAKQKLLSLETSKEEEETESRSSSAKQFLTTADHTKEFHTLFNKDDSDNDQSILFDIPGDDAYDSDDLMAPLREKPARRIHTETTGSRLKRSDTVSSYFTRNEGRLRSGTLDVSYTPQLPLDLRKLDSFVSNEEKVNARLHTDSFSTISEDLDDYNIYSDKRHEALHITNPDYDSD